MKNYIYIFIAVLLILVITILFPKFIFWAYFTLGAINVIFSFLNLPSMLSSKPSQSRFYRILAHIKYYNSNRSFKDGVLNYISLSASLIQLFIFWPVSNLHQVIALSKSSTSQHFDGNKNSNEYRHEIGLNHIIYRSLYPNKIVYLVIASYLALFTIYLDILKYVWYRDIVAVVVVISICLLLIRVPLKISFIEDYKKSPQSIHVNVIFVFISLLLLLALSISLIDNEGGISLQKVYQNLVQIITLSDTRKVWYSETNFIQYILSLNTNEKLKIIVGFIAYVSIGAKILDFKNYNRSIEDYEIIVQKLNNAEKFNEALKWTENTPGETNVILLEKSVALVGVNSINKSLEIIDAIKLKNNSNLPSEFPSSALLFSYIHINPIPKYILLKVIANIHNDLSEYSIYESFHVVNYCLENKILNSKEVYDILISSSKPECFKASNILARYYEFESITKITSKLKKEDADLYSDFEILLDLIDLIALSELIKYDVNYDTNVDLSELLKKFHDEFYKTQSLYKRFVLGKIYITRVFPNLKNSQYTHQAENYVINITNNLNAENIDIESIDDKVIFIFEYSK